MREITIDDVRDDDVKPQFIENPLPMPKRREHREMDYALLVDADDDYDITDMSGIDFFDV